MKNKLISILFFCLTLSAGMAQARVSSVTVQVDGMACPFCAFGVEKRLTKVAGVARVRVDMESGSAVVTAKPGASIYFQKVAGAVKEAGFTAGGMQIRAIGVVVEEDGGYHLRIADFPITLTLVDAENTVNFSALATSGREVELHGGVEVQGDGWILTVQDHLLEVSP